MKDQYVADINDFVKYGLLRQLGRSHDLFVCWMLTPPDGRNDGARLGYLRQPDAYRAFDPELFDALSGLVRSAKRSVREVERAGFLSTVGSLGTPIPDESAARDRYFAELWRSVGTRSVLFFDPDNGLDVPSVQLGQPGSAKYVYRRELEFAVKNGNSVIVYQHFPRVARRPFLQRVLAELGDLAPSCLPIAIYTSRVAYLAVVNDQAHPDLRHDLLMHAKYWRGLVRVEERRSYEG